MTLAPDHRPLLPMAGQTHGRRSPVTCHLRCGDACSFTPPNTSHNHYFRDVASSALSRRAVLGGMAAGAAVAALVPGLDAPAAAAPGSGARARMPFTPIAPVTSTVDDMTVPVGYRGSPSSAGVTRSFSAAAAFDPEHQSPRPGATVRLQQRLPRHHRDQPLRDAPRSWWPTRSTRTRTSCSRPDTRPSRDSVRIAMAAHGMAVVELTRRKAASSGRYIVGRPAEPPHHARHPVHLRRPGRRLGPAQDAGRPDAASRPSARWATAPAAPPHGARCCPAKRTSTATSARRAPTPPRPATASAATQDSAGWGQIDPRFDATTGIRERAEPVRLDRRGRPQNPDSTPVKHTALGRFKHEGANVIINRTVMPWRTWVMTSDSTTCTSSSRAAPSDTAESARAARRTTDAAQHGDLSVARFTGDGLEDGVSDGTGEWIPLTRNGRSVARVQPRGGAGLHAARGRRRRADQDGPSRGRGAQSAQRPDLRRLHQQHRPRQGRQGRADRAEPAQRQQGRPRRRDHPEAAATTPTARSRGTCSSSAATRPPPAPTSAATTDPVSPISCPDNVAFDSVGNLWVSTDGQPSALSHNDGLFKVPLAGPERGRVQQFLAVPTGAETCGPVVHDNDGKGSVFVAVQHPGENGTWAAQHSVLPRFRRSR